MAAVSNSLYAYQVTLDNSQNTLDNCVLCRQGQRFKTDLMYVRRLHVGEATVQTRLITKIIGAFKFFSSWPIYYTVGSHHAYSVHKRYTIL
jgi:hypothetical protein